MATKAVVLSEIEFRLFVMDEVIVPFVEEVEAGYASEEDFVDYVISKVEEWMDAEKVDEIVILGKGYEEIFSGRDFIYCVEKYYRRSIEDLLKEMLKKPGSWKRRIK